MNPQYGPKPMNGPSREHVHVVGVAGVGMSALAGAMLGAGYEVTGSDRYLDQGESLDVLERLAAAGVALHPQDGSALRPATSAVAVSTAIEADNADLAAAARLGVPVVHRASMLARLARGRRVVAIAGTSGKTTVTGLLGWLLTQAGWDPTVVNGGIVLDWRGPAAVGNYRHGSSDWFILETDESDKSLLSFQPEWAAITNVSKDHFELGEVIEVFREFAARVRQPLVAGPGVGSLLGIPCEEPPGDLRCEGGRWVFTFGGQEWRSPMEGRHNAENAALAVVLAARMGAPLDRLHASLATFRGIHRRLERVGEGRGIRVLDDYAHNPAKIGASWRAVAESAGRILGFWRPHGFGPLALMKEELAATLLSVCRPQDRLFVLPVYYAGGTAARRYSAEEFVALLQARGVPAQWVPDYGVLEARLWELTCAGDTILGMGARDPELPVFARRMARVLTGV